MANILTPDSIDYVNGLKVCNKIIPWDAKWQRDVITDGYHYRKGDPYKANRYLSGGTGKVQGVTIHNTPRLEHIADGATQAEQYTRATWPNCAMGTVRVHYYVDELAAWKNLREDEVGWHAADGMGPGNDTTVAIEIIMDGSGSEADKAAEKNGALLAATMLDWYGLTIDRLYTHRHWHAKKYCPAYLLPHWDDFTAQVQANMERFHAAPEPPAEASATAQGETVPKGDYDNLKACFDGLHGDLAELLNKYK